ncbi:cytochrome P450 [Byssothecium circinans]|uniref:Cytochrome P450 n=1 Tax=Byssothecium circinans TaxID=147558 RepID=A0A6A5TI84_9PLEO|nr:cytochrome P450 [Byssothecium circinans]
MASTYSIVTSHLDDHPKLTCAILATLVISVVHYAATQALYSKATHGKGHQKTPPVVPHFLPFIGNVPWQYFWSPIEFFKSRSSYYALLQHPVRVKFFTRELYIIQGRENVVAHLAQTSNSNTIFNASFLRQGCAMSAKAVERLESESEETPKYFKRKYLAASPLYSWSSSVIHRYLAGRSALQLSRRFENNLRGRIEAHPALGVPGGVVLNNFLDFFSNDVTAALLDSMCGKGLLERNPAFTRAFFTFCDNFPTFLKRTPQFLAPRAYSAREEVLAAVIDWQTWASENFDANTTPLDEDGDDPLWGTAFFRERFSTFVHEMGFDARDMASMELGFLVGASANVTLNTYWCAIDVFKDRALLNDIRKEVEACKIGDKGDLRFDLGKLIQQPLLQAVFAESLRLRSHLMFIRKTTEAINILDWIIPKDRIVIAWSTPGHMDSKVWSDPSDLHPVDTFWPGRFLKFTDQSESAQFSLPETEGSWLPFGNGAVICPGRHFAKLHCIVTLAMMVESFDCDILAEPKSLKVDQSKFGMGVLGPSGKVPARLRQRED